MRLSFLHTPFLNGPRPIYWLMQVFTWSMYVGMFYVWNSLNGRQQSGIELLLLMEVITGMAASHLLRYIILKKGLLNTDIGDLLPRLALYASLVAIFATLLEMALHDLLLTGFKPLSSEPFLTHVNRTINWGLLLIIWAISYLAYCYFIQNRREEIRSLRMETANRENQLNTLRAQMNPHFMFNALNGIRALVDENPEQAKRAITQLSAILRNAMTTVKRRTVPLGEELDIVKAYLALEAMRFEERLQVSFDIDPELTRVSVPPMLLQTLVENAVKHGIAKLTKGGEVRISVHRGLNGLVMMVANSGTYEPGVITGTGIGLRNTRKRLGLLYGPNAALRIEERNGMVVTEVELPEEK